MRNDLIEIWINDVHEVRGLRLMTIDGRGIGIGHQLHCLSEVLCCIAFGFVSLHSE
jgi:hypothetical protein